MKDTDFERLMGGKLQKTATNKKEIKTSLKWNYLTEIKNQN